MELLIPDSWGSDLLEFNTCHTPGGSPAGGQFCSTELPDMTAPDGDIPRRGSPQASTRSYPLSSEYGQIWVRAIAEKLGGPLTHLFVDSAYIHRRYQGKGWGKKLYLATTEYAKARGYDGLISSVSFRSESAQHAWASLRKTGRVRTVYRDVGSNPPDGLGHAGAGHVPLDVLERGGAALSEFVPKR